MFNFIQNKKGFTLLELIVSIGIFSLVIAGAVWLLVGGLRYNTIIWDNLEGQTEGRKAVKKIIETIRKAEESSLGSYPILTANDNEMIFYANVDSDSYIEKIRFWLDGTTLKKGLTKPNGEPLDYSGEEQIIDLAHYVVNISEDVPLFSYYDEDYSGTEESLTTPAETAVVRFVKIHLEIEKDSSKTPEPLEIDGAVQIRNLKEN